MLIAGCTADFSHLKDHDALEPDVATAGSGGPSSETGGSASSGDAGSETPIASDGGMVGSAESTLKLARALCDRNFACIPNRMRQLYGDEPTCVARFRIFFENSVLVPGIAYTDADRDACADEVTHRSCDDVRHGNQAAACRRIVFEPGTLPDGAPCNRSNQCASNYCPFMCGSTCSAKPGVGAPCGTCDDDLVCAPNKTCAVPVPPGGDCDDGHPCQSDLFCLHGTCTSLVREGATCDPKASSTDPAVRAQSTTSTCEWMTEGLGCYSGKCTRTQGVGDGEACGWISGVYHDCSASGFCSTSTPSECLPHAEDGATCNDSVGPHCMPPALCQNGRCVIRRGGVCE
jgi:hypothetical protein